MDVQENFKIIFENYKILGKSRVKESNDTVSYEVQPLEFGEKNFRLSFTSIKNSELDLQKQYESTKEIMSLVNHESNFMRSYLVMLSTEKPFLMVLSDNYLGTLKTNEEVIAKGRNDVRQVSLDILRGMDFLDKNYIIHGSVEKENIKIQKSLNTYRAKIDNFTNSRIRSDNWIQDENDKNSVFVILLDLFRTGTTNCNDLFLESASAKLLLESYGNYKDTYVKMPSFPFLWKNDELIEYFFHLGNLPDSSKSPNKIVQTHQHRTHRSSDKAYICSFSNRKLIQTNNERKRND